MSKDDVCSEYTFKSIIRLEISRYIQWHVKAIGIGGDILPQKRNE